jgi:hypothetical protein
LVWRRIDAEEWLAFFDISAFLKEPLEDDAIHARTHLGDANR